MPFLIKVHGQLFDVPQGPWKIQHTEIDSLRYVRIRREYHFNRPNTAVTSKIFESPFPDYMVAEDGPLSSAELEQEVLVDQQIIHIRSFTECLDRASVPASHVKADQFNDYVAYKGDKSKYPAKEENMPQRKTGARIRIARRGGPTREGAAPEYLRGTVIVCDSTPRGHVLLCMDNPRPGYTSSPDLCGRHHGIIVPEREVRGPGMASASEKYAGLPEFIGMTVMDPLKFQGRTFRAGSVGRVVSMDAEYVTLKWLNVPGLGEFFVPRSCLRWCRFDPERSSCRVLAVWPGEYSTLEEGDILIYQGSKPIVVDGGQHAITGGALLKHVGWDSERCCVKASILSGTSPSAVGQVVVLRKGDVHKFEGEFVPASSSVEVVAEVRFKRTNLQGKRGRVILGTDCEGDIGVQFFEDLGAGSLDGVGEEGKCLYIPASSVRIILREEKNVKKQSA
jgi:hypothetical protein